MSEPFSIIPLTPDGRGGIGSLLISGPGAEEAFRTLFTFPSGRAPIAGDLAVRRSRPIYGHFSLGEGCMRKSSFAPFPRKNWRFTLTAAVRSAGRSSAV